MPNEPQCPKALGVVGVYYDDMLAIGGPATTEAQRRTCLKSVLNSVPPQDKVVGAHRLDDASGHGWWIYAIPNGAAGN